MSNGNTHALKRKIINALLTVACFVVLIGTIVVLTEL